MLNRRILRVKTMQTLYAYRIVRQAIYELSKEYLVTLFEPNYMAEVPEDRKQLKKDENLAIASFNEWIKDSVYDYKDKPDKISAAVTKTIKYYTDSLNKDTQRLKNKLIIEIEDIFDNYLKVLAIAEELRNIAESNNSPNLKDNPVIHQLKTNSEFNKELISHNISWNSDLVELRKFYKGNLVKNEEYKAYEELKNPTYQQHQDIVLHILRKLVFDDKIINALFEEKDMYWAENKNILKGMIKKTIKDLTPETDENAQLLDISENWEEDKLFIQKLFDGTVSYENESSVLIADKSKNWEIDRLALTDRIILTMGLCEMINFPNIPVKVTINEYIDISKLYSTPQSKQFINGLLDNLSIQLIENGTIKKSGRGLIDNK